MVEVVEMIAKDEVRVLDTFLEPSNMTRGISAAEAKKLHSLARAGKLKLVPMDSN